MKLVTIYDLLVHLKTSVIVDLLKLQVCLHWILILQLTVGKTKKNEQYDKTPCRVSNP
jgi:cytochrome c oxidase subunit IV